MTSREGNHGRDEHPLKALFQKPGHMSCGKFYRKTGTNRKVSNPF